MRFAATLLAFQFFAFAQTPNPKYQADVQSVDSIVRALYDVISGPAGPRDWDRFRNLFHAGARLIPTRTAPDGEVTARALTPEDYVANGAKSFATQGFFEGELHRETQDFGQIVHVFSTYETRREAKGALLARGINSKRSPERFGPGRAR